MTLDHIPKNLHKSVPDRPDTRAAPSCRRQGSHNTPRNRPSRTEQSCRQVKEFLRYYEIRVRQNAFIFIDFAGINCDKHQVSANWQIPDVYHNLSLQNR